MTCRTQDPHGEEGIALFYALLVTLVVAGIVAVVFATALTEQRQAAFELDFEDTIHVAEAGAEIYLGYLVDDNERDTGIPGPTALGQDPASWAIETALDHDGTTYVHDAVGTTEGETVALRPEGQDAEFIYGVGFTPSRDAYRAFVDSGVGRAYARVVRVQVAFAPNTYDPQQALITGGNMRLGGNYKIAGSAGSVHTNGAIEIIGSTGEAAAGVSFSGSCLNYCDEAIGPVDTEVIDQPELLDFWRSDQAIVITGRGDFYEYCPGGWHRRVLGQTEPCVGGNLVGTAVADTQPWTGLSYSSPLTPSDAVYFFPGDYDVDVKQPTGRLSIFTGGDVTIGPSATSDPPTARYPGWLVFAEGDVDVGGNAAAGSVFESTEPAAVYAKGTISLNGNISTDQITFVSLDSLNVGSNYSGGGAGTIRFNGDLTLIIPGEKTPLVVQWDEVFAS